MIRLEEELVVLRSENRELRKKLDEARQLLMLLRDRALAVADENRKLHDALARLDTDGAVDSGNGPDEREPSRRPDR